uniref:Methyltranfer_dom domain-containing protein n=1 Tax=Strongyloides papillosus TaxID=174720 RepID=A0A0N5CF45_STREA
MEKELVKEIHEFLKNYGNYADQYMLDYYIEKQWSSIPKEWQSFFESKKDTIDDIALYILDITNNKFDNEAPTSLLKIKNDIKNILNTLFTDKSFYQTEKCDFSEIPKSLLTKIKQKKLHELQYLVPLIKHLYTVSNSSFNQIVDYGAGIGHLSRILAYCLKDYVDIEISTVEGNDKFVEKSIELDKIFENKLKHLEKEVSNFKIERESKLISDNNDFSSQNKSSSCKKLILGLHTCGDFASTLIKHYYVNTEAAALVNVGCCYHKLNNGSDMKYRQIYDATEDEVHENYSYPMSNEKDIFPQLSYAARELACHGLRKKI